MSIDKVQDITLEAAQPIKAVFCFGADKEIRLTLTPLLSKGGNVYWTVPGSRPRFGRRINTPSSVQGKLPNRIYLESMNGVQIGGEFLDLKAGSTQKDRPKVSGAKLLTVPFVDKGEVKRFLTVTVSDQGDAYNVICSAISMGGPGEAEDMFEE